MVLQMIEGFETRTEKSNWSWGGNAMSTAGRFGGICYHGSSTALYNIITPVDDVIVGFARKYSAANSIFQVGTALTSGQVRLDFNNVGGFDVRRGSTVFMSSDPALMTIGVWYFIEVKIKVHDTTGYIVVRLNGVEVINYTGDTCGTTAADLKIVQLEFVSGSNNNLDDVYFCDTTGSEFNDFLGEILVETESPNGNGAFSQLLGSDGNSTDNYLLVDELPATDTDYAGSATVGQRDTYTFTDPTHPGQILAVQTSAQISKIAAGDASVKTIQRLSNGVEYVSPAFVASNLHWANEGPRVRDPENAVWTNASVTAAQFGVEVA